MSLRWEQENGDQVTYTLLDSTNERVAEVFEVYEDEWHYNVLDVMHGVSTSVGDAKKMVFEFLGIRPER